MTKLKIEELTLINNQISVLREILESAHPDESTSTFNSENQKLISILSAQERSLVKEKMIRLIDKYFK